MKKILLCLFLLSSLSAMAQTTPVKVTRNANHFVYASYGYGESIDTQYTQIEIYAGSDYTVTQGNALVEFQSRPWVYGPNNYIKGYSVEDIFVNEFTDTITYLTTIFDGDKREQYRTVSPFSRKDIKYDTAQVNGLTRYTCFINSNKLEFYVQPFETIWNWDRNTKGKATRALSPVPYYGRFPGLLVSFWRNGQCLMQLTKTEKVHSSKFWLDTRVPLISNRELSNLKRQKMVVTTRIFDSVQLCWCGKNDHIKGNYRMNTPFDSVLHYAGGTLVLKRIQLPKLPAHYQTFLELHQRSNGDAYDRTGSVFVIPEAYIDLKPNFFDGINNHPDSLPLFIGHDGEHYQGIRRGLSHLRQYYHSSFIYEPPVELMRFFTPFGVGQFNDRVQIDGLDWEDEAYYKQEVTDLAQLLQGEVWIGVWIGNYDKGGHTVTLEIKSFPGDTCSNQTIASHAHSLTPATCWRWLGRTTENSSAQIALRFNLTFTTRTPIIAYATLPPVMAAGTAATSSIPKPTLSFSTASPSSPTPLGVVTAAATASGILLAVISGTACPAATSLAAAGVQEQPHNLSISPYPNFRAAATPLP